MKRRFRAPAVRVLALFAAIGLSVRASAADEAKLKAELFAALDASAFGGAVTERSVAERFRTRPDQPGAPTGGTCDREAADKAASGAMCEINIDWTFPDGRVDWLFNPTRHNGPLNHEWLWQLNRMGFWHPLADAYRVTRDERYARAFRGQLRGWISQTDCPEDFNGPDSAWRTIEAGMRLGGSWTYAFEAFRKSPTLTDEDICLFVASMYAQARHLMANRTERNWLLMEMNGVYTFASCFPELREARKLRTESARIFSEAIASQVLPDGFHDELSPDYHSVFYGCATQLLRLDRLYGREGELPDSYVKLLEDAAGAYLALATPNFRQHRSNDCYTMRTVWVLGPAAGLFPAREDFRWAATEGGEGRPPDGPTASRLLPWAGFAAMRTDWGRDATYLCFDFGPLGEAHEHQDKLGFSLWKGAQELVFDDGGGQYEESAFRRYGRSGYGHNTLLVDGLAQMRREPRRLTAPADVGWESTAVRDRAQATYDQGFGPKELLLAVQTREVVLDKTADVVTLTDAVTSADGKDHDYELLFHVDSTNVTVAADGRSAVVRFPHRRWGLVIESEADGASVTSVSGQVEPFVRGWRLGRNGEKNRPATTVSVSAKKRRDFTFRTRLRVVRSADL